MRRNPGSTARNLTQVAASTNTTCAEGNAWSLVLSGNRIEHDSGLIERCIRSIGPAAILWGFWREGIPNSAGTANGSELC